VIETTAKAETFRLRTPLLSQGRSHHVLAATDMVNVAIKCYSSGGENALHTHVGEDHVFVVLQGRARFYDSDGKETELGRNQGILLPRGWFYRFESCADEPLILLRFGARQPGERTATRTDDRIAPDGHHLDPSSEENKHVGEPVVIEGAFYE
jgi:mannose-6-phosphate isomerase-like protein (cupin superfamily)